MNPSHELRQRERQDAHTIAQWWRDLWRSLTAPVRTLLDHLRGVRLPSTRQRDPLTRTTLHAIGSALTGFGHNVASLIHAAQSWAVTLGAAGIAVAHGVTLGRLANGTTLGQAQSTHVAHALDAITKAVRLPSVTLRGIRNAAGDLVQRGLLTARNELYRGYRAGYLAVGRLQGRSGWYWHAELDRRTCPVCVARHGSYHTADESLDSHAGCRCVPRWEKPRESGAQWFSDQDSATRTLVLGPGKAKLYEAGTITLDDLVVPTYSPRWGHGARVATLAELTGG